MSNLAELLIKDLSQTMRTTLAPFIERMEHTDKQYKTLVTIMNSMPEFKKMMEENNLLKEELKRQAGPTLEPVTLEPVTLEPVTLELEPAILVLEPVTLEPVTLEPVTLEPVTLEITPLADNTPNTFNVTEHVKEIYDTFNAEDASEVEEEEVEEEEVEEEEVEEEEVEEEEEEASEAEEEIEEDASEVEEEEVEEDASEAEEEASEAEEESEEEVEEEVEEEEDSEEEVFIVEIDDVEYYTNDEVNGVIYSINVNEEVGENVGKFIDGEPTFL